MAQVKCSVCGNVKSGFISASEKSGEGCDCETEKKKDEYGYQEEPPDQKGDGIKDIIDRIKAFFKGPRNNYSPSIRSLFEKIPEEKIVSLRVCRAPIQSAIQKIIDLVSLRKTPYDKLFHLYGLLKLENGDFYRFEKNQVIAIQKYNRESDSDCVQVPLSKSILFGEFFMKGQQSIGTDYFKYDGFSNNCQDFILGVLKGNGLLNEELKKFIKQDVENLVPSFVEDLGKKVTDLAGSVDVLQNGEGLGHRLISTPNGMMQVGFN
jgi:hypothetical protein